MLEAAVYLAVAVVMTAAFLPGLAKRMRVNYKDDLDVLALWFFAILTGLFWPLTISFGLFILLVKILRSWIDRHSPPSSPDNQSE